MERREEVTPDEYRERRAELVEMRNSAAEIATPGWLGVLAMIDGQIAALDAAYKEQTDD